MKRTVEVDRDLALIGATARVKQLSAEIDKLYSIFPELRVSGRRQGAASSVGGGKRKRVFSAAAKRRMSAGMRKYWARRRTLGAAKGARTAAAVTKA